MRIFAVDPGPEQSAAVMFDGRTVLEHGLFPNMRLLERIAQRLRSGAEILVIEQVVSFGMPVGAEVFETVFWSGRFTQAWVGYHAPSMLLWTRLKRLDVKMALCHDSRAKDANIRQALIDRFGPGKKKAIGTKKQPGPLYGLAGDEWSALAVAVTYWDQLHHRQQEVARA